MNNTQQYIVAIDGGASNCRTILATSSGKIIAKITGGPANIRNDAKGSYKEIIRCCNKSLEKAKLDKTCSLSNLSVYAGLAGAERSHLKKKFLNFSWPFKSIEVFHDGEIAVDGAFSGNDGGIVIVGTGISACYKLNGSVFHLSGYGFPFDDKGSGAWLGQRALQIALRTYEGLMHENLLAKEILKHFNNDFNEAFSFTINAVSSDYASLAPFVWKCVDNGEPLSHVLIEESVLEIETLLYTMENNGVNNLALVGGISTRMLDWLSPYWKKRCKKPDEEPLIGAYNLALKRFDNQYV